MKYSLIKCLCFLMAATLLASCGIYGSYSRPDEVNTQGLIRDAVSDTDTLSASAGSTFGNLPWREVFTDSQLQKLIEQGLEKNSNLLNAIQNVKIAEAQLMASRLSFLPSISLGPNASYTYYNYDLQPSTKAYSLPINASWNVDLFGKLLSSSRAAQKQLLLAEDNQMAVRSQVICGIANTYYTLLMLDRQLAISKEMCDMAKETYDMMKLQHELGRVRSTGVQSAEASYLSVVTQVNDLERQIRTTENALSLLIGQAGQQIPRSTLEIQSLPEKFSVGVGAQLLENRPDVHAAEMQLAQCFHGKQNARAQFLPGINITASGGWSNLQGNVDPGHWLWQLGASLTQPIFANGKLVAGLKVAKAQYEIAFNNWQNAVLSAGNEVSNALVNYNKYDANSRIEAQRVALLEKNVEDTKSLYKNSSSSYLEVLTAQTQLLSAQIQKVSDDFYKMQAVVSLYQALGGGAK